MCLLVEGFDKYSFQGPFFSVSWEKVGGNHCMYPVQFELKGSGEGSSSQMGNSSVSDT